MSNCSSRKRASFLTRARYLGTSLVCKSVCSLVCNSVSLLVCESRTFGLSELVTLSVREPVVLELTKSVTLLVPKSVSSELLESVTREFDEIKEGQVAKQVILSVLNPEKVSSVNRYMQLAQKKD